VKLVKNVMIPMPDGVRLAADVYLPDDGRDDLSVDRPLPVVMDYIPYRKDELNPAMVRMYTELPRRGYPVVRVDIRGTGASEGVNVDEYTLQEQLDGAAHAPAHLTSIIPVDFTDDRYTDDCHYRGGLLRMYYDIGWYGTRMIAWNAMPPDPEWVVGDWAEVWERHVAENEPYLLKWLEQQVDGPYWRNGSVGDGSGIRCPVFLIGGWRDGYPNPPLRLFRNLRSRGVPAKVLVGPWNHAYPDAAIPGPRIDHLDEVVRWLDHWCRGAENGVMDEPPVVVWMQGSEPPVVDRLDSAGEWRAETAWPAPGATERVLYLAGAGRLADAADSAAVAGPGGAAAAHSAAHSAATDHLVYHPAVGVTGGLWSGGIQFGLPGDQRPDEALSLVYTSDPLPEDLAILGWPVAELTVSTDATVLGFAASLCDVAPDGSSHLVGKGMLNITRRDSLTEPSPAPPGEPVTLRIEIDCTGWIFSAGHRIRLDLANADFPNVWPTPEAARSLVHLGDGRSRLVLPVVPRSGSAQPPVFRASPVVPSPHAAAVRPPTWQVTRDVLTGRTTATVQVDVAFRVDERTTIERQFASICTVDPARPADASAHGWHVNRVIRANQVIEGRCDTVIQSTADQFHVTIDLRITVNGAQHATRRWTRSIPRRLL
jgi:hypothetical protein